MTEARHTFTGRLAVDAISLYGIDRAFREVRFYPEGTDDGGPVLLLSNHFSWWDGFIQHRLNLRYFKRKDYVMMLEEQLCRHPFLNRCGAFSVRKNSPDLFRSLRYAAGLLKDGRNMVVLFPEGELRSAHTERLEMQRGASYLLRQAGTDAQVVFNVNLADYGPYRRPTLCVYVKACGTVTPDSLPDEFGEYYKACKSSQTQLWKP